MALIGKHSKTNNITDWTQPELDVVIGGGAAPLLPGGTVLNDIVLPSDWNADIPITGTVEDAQVPESAVTQYEAALSIDGSQIVAGSLGDTQFDSATNASLDLADTAVQPGALGSYVPYTGATTNVNIGSNNFTTTGEISITGNGLISNPGSYLRIHNDEGTYANDGFCDISSNGTNKLMQFGRSQLNLFGSYNLNFHAAASTRGALIGSNYSAQIQPNTGNAFFTGNLRVGHSGTAAAALHVIRTTSPQQRIGYSTTQYIDEIVSSAGLSTRNAVGSNPGHLFNINGTNKFIVGNLFVTVSNTDPLMVFNGSASSMFTGVGYEAAHVGIWCGDGDEEIATYDVNTASYSYFNGSLHGLDTAITCAVDLDVTALLRCNSFRIDQTPTAETPTPTHTITMSANGVDYKIPCLAA